MAVVIRLQGLRVTAGSEDIRKFFTGLKIPDGGVHIIGGDREEAFIIFASDEDARRAMTRSGGCIRGTPVTLLLSSKSEMQNMLEESTKVAQLAQNRSPEESPRRLEMDPAKGARRTGNPEAGRRSGHSPSRFQRASSNCNNGLYVFLKGLPFSVTEKEIRDFFCGLLVDGIILLKNARGQNNGQALVKFATNQDASEGLKRDREYIGTRYVDVYTATEKQWCGAGGIVVMGANNDGKFERGRSADRTQRNPQHRERSRSPLAPSSSSSEEEFCVLLENLSLTIEKEHIKHLLHPARIENDQILYTIGSDGRRTRSAFVLFKSLRDYCAALTHHNEEFLNRRVSITTVSREKMISILKSSKINQGLPGNSAGFQEQPTSHPKDSYDNEKMCLYLRNLPFDVRKNEIMDFFLGYNITEDKVILLLDNRGAGLGEALVLFQSERDALSAQSLNGQRFLGTEVMLKCISRSQVQQFGIELPKVQEPPSREERYSSWGSEASFRHGDTTRSEGRISHDGNIPMKNQQAGGSDYDSYTAGPNASQNKGNGVSSSVHDGFGPTVQNFDGPTCIKLVNLPFQIRTEEIYDFCYGYSIIPGSVSLQHDKHGKPKGSATVVFESRKEALTAIDELSGRPIGARKIQLVFV